MGFFNFTRKAMNDVGVDLGTVNTLITTVQDGIILNQPSVVAIDHSKSPPKIIDVGQPAKEMIGRTPEHIRAIRPLKEGVIAEVEWAEVMLKRFLQQAMQQKLLALPPRMIIGIPSGATAAERRAVGDAGYSSGARMVYLVDEPLAAAIGSDIPVERAQGTLIVDIGGGTTEIAVLSLNGIVASKSVRIAGDHLNEDIRQYLERAHQICIGERTAEEIKIHLGSAIPSDDMAEMEVRGVNLKNGMPTTVSVSAGEIRECMSETLETIAQGIKSILEVTPPELVADIMNQGIILTGGGAMLSGLDEWISQQVDVTVCLAPSPLESVVRGTEKILNDKTYRRILEYSLYDPHTNG